MTLQYTMDNCSRHTTVTYLMVHPRDYLPPSLSSARICPACLRPTHAQGTTNNGCHAETVPPPRRARFLPQSGAWLTG